MSNQKSSQGREPSRSNCRSIIEPLENRQLLHGGLFGWGGGFGGGEGGGGDGGFGGHGGGGSTITFSQAPTAVQTGLDSLASNDGLTAPTSTQTVYLSNIAGVERYSIDLTGTGTQSVLTVDQNGSPVTAPTRSTTTFGTLNTAAANEITAIASALSLTAPTSTTPVNVSTASGGLATYSVNLSPSSTTTTGHFHHGTTITVDANGNPVGNQSLPFSVMPTAVQNGLTAHEPSGAGAIASTQNVQVRTLDGVTTYSIVFNTSGTRTTVTVNASGALTSLPSHTTTTFSAIPAATQTEISTLAAADGYTGTIAGTQTVDAYDEANGTTVYSVNLPVNKTGNSGGTYTINITISADQNGNPTTRPTDGFGFGDFNFFGFGHRAIRGF